MAKENYIEVGNTGIIFDTQVICLDAKDYNALVCYRCAFFLQKCHEIPCLPTQRYDGKSVFFREIKEV